jgi:hypothetical protein
VKFAATHTNNYWSPLACLVKEQEELLEPEETNTSVDWAMNATTDIGPTNKVAAHWARKINNRTLRKMVILDTGATSGAAPEEDKECFVDTGEASTKTFMFPDKRMKKATKRMLTKHNLRPAAREMNIVPRMQATQWYLAREGRQSMMITLQQSRHPTPPFSTPTDAKARDFGNSHWTTTPRKPT